MNLPLGLQQKCSELFAHRGGEEQLLSTTQTHLQKGADSYTRGYFWKSFSCPFLVLSTKP